MMIITRATIILLIIVPTNNNILLLFIYLIFIKRAEKLQPNHLTFYYAVCMPSTRENHNQVSVQSWNCNNIKVQQYSPDTMQMSTANSQNIC